MATFKFGLLTIRQHSATRKHLFPYPQGDRSGLTKPKLASTPITAATTADLTIKSGSVLTNPIEKDGV